MTKLTTELFIEKAQQVHHSKYKYTKTVYVHSQHPVIITCPIHGDFEQVPSSHLQGRGCKECANEIQRKARLHTLETFIQKATIIHNNRYSYANAVYSKNSIKLRITCPIHGDFEQTPSSHLRGSGCPKCASLNIPKTHTGTSWFIAKASKRHNNQYSYHNVQYVDNKTKISINCPVHGVFQQIPNHHLQGSGCPKCGKTGQNLWSYSNWEKAGKQSKKFEGFSIYVLECWNENERFLKIGKTYTSIAHRYKSNTLPYMFTIVAHVYGQASNISKLETMIKQDYKEDMYKPLIAFGGQYECFTITSKSEILKQIQGL